MAKRPISKNVSIQLLMGVILGLLIGLLFSYNAASYLPKIAPFFLKLLVSAFILFMLLFFLITWYQERITQRFFGQKEKGFSDIRQETKEVSGALAKEWVKKNLGDFPDDLQQNANRLIPRFSAFLMWVFARNWFFRSLIAVFIAIGGMVTTILLFNQNELLHTQNDLLVNQNSKIETQLNLAEASRRSSLIFLMSSVLDRVDHELDIEGDSISDGLVGRIAALSRTLKPYRYYEADTLTSRSISPERGQLLLSLINYPIRTSILEDIFERASFQAAELNEAHLNTVSLRKIYLDRGDLRDVTAIRSDFQAATLSGSDLTDANFQHANLKEADLGSSTCFGTNFSEAVLDRSNFQNTQAWGAIFWEAEGIRTDFRQADLSDADFTNANLSEANFANSILTRTNFHGANLEDAIAAKANFQHADLSNAILRNGLFKNADWRNIHLFETDLIGAVLDSVIINDPDLFDSEKIIGLSDIENRYQINEIPDLDSLGQKIFIIISKQ